MQKKVNIMLSEKINQYDNCTITVKCKYNRDIETIIIEMTTTAKQKPAKQKPKNIGEILSEQIDSQRIVGQTLDGSFSEEGLIQAHDF